MTTRDNSAGCSRQHSQDSRQHHRDSTQQRLIFDTTATEIHANSSSDSWKLQQIRGKNIPEDSRENRDGQLRKLWWTIKKTVPRWARIFKNTDWSTGPLAHPFARSLASLTPSLAPHYSLRSRPPLRSLVRSLAHFAHSLARGKVNFRWLFCLCFFFYSGP